MNTTIKTIDEQRVELSITATWDHVKDDYTDLLKRYGKIEVKGFRQGSTPEAIVEKKFRKEIQDDLTFLCSQRLCRKALKESQLKPGSPISVSHVEMLPRELFSFKAKFLRMPDFELPDYMGLHLQSESEEDKLTEVSEQLLTLTRLEVSNDFVEEELRFSDFEENIPEESHRQEAEKRVKLLMILKKIADTDGIEVDELDVNSRIEAIAGENDVSNQELKSYLMEIGGYGRLRDLLLAEQVLSYLVEINS